MAGVALILHHPEIPSCAECQQWLHDKDWKKVKRGGKPVARPAGTSLPCAKCPKSDDGQPAPHKELSAKNWQAYRYWLEIRAGAPMPDDPITRRNCGLIKRIEDQAERSFLMQTLLLGQLQQRKR